MAIKVNGQEIPEQAISYEFSRLVRFYSQFMSADQIKEQMESLKERAKEQAIGAKLLIDQASKMDFQVAAEMIDKKLQMTINEMGGEEEYKKVLEKQGMSEDAVVDNIKEGCRVDMLVEKVTEGLADPTEDEMKVHFKEHSKEYVKQERAQASHILIKPESDTDEHKKAANDKIDEIKKRIDEGANFVDEATEHSDCPSGKSNGGSLSWFSRGMMVPEFDEVVFGMKVGELSEVLETQFGFHIISKTGHEEGSEAEYEDVKEKILEFMRHTTRGEALTVYVNDLKEKADITDE